MTPAWTCNKRCRVRRAGRLATALAVLVLAAATARSGVYYVNDASVSNDLWCTAAGLAANDGLSPETPADALQTILGLYTLGSNDTVFVDTGVYLLSAPVVIASPHGGVEGLPAVIQGVPRASVFKAGPSFPGGSCVSNLASHIVFRDLSFSGGTLGLAIDSSFCSGATVAGNTFYGNTAAGLAIQPSGYPVYGDFLIIRNLVYDNPSGMIFSQQIGAMGDTLRVINNTVTATNGAALAMGYGSGANSELYNNILVAPAGGVCLDVLTEYGLFASDYNAFYASNGAPLIVFRRYGVTNFFASLGAWQRHTATNFYACRDEHSLSRNPSFASPPNADYHLASFGGRWQPDAASATGGVWITDALAHSPCIDTASPWLYTDDLAAEPSPNGGRKNMGAYGGGKHASKTPPGRMLVAYAPDLGQNPSDPQPLLWTASGQLWTSNDLVRLDFSCDGGATWTPIAGAAAVPVYPSSFAWDRPTASFGTPQGCLVRVAETNNPAIHDLALLEPLDTPTARVLYVNDASRTNDLWCTATGDDAHDGLSPATPMASVQAAIDRYRPGLGSTLYIDAGLYPLTNTLVLPPTAPGIGEPGSAHFRLVGAGTRTVLDRQNAQASTVCLRIQQDFAWVEGIVVRGAKTGIEIDPATCRNAIISNTVITANSGYAVHVLPDPVDQGFDHYVFKNNLVYGNGEGLNLQADAGYRRAHFTVQNNTVVTYGRSAISLGGQSQGAALRNNILSTKGAGWCLDVARAGALATSDYNCFFAYNGAGVARWPTNNTFQTALTLADWQAASGADAFSFNRDPLFASPSAGNYHLRSAAGSWHNGIWITDTVTSPCIDAGDPASPYALEPSPNGGRINLGAYGNTPEASRSATVRMLSLLAPRGGETVSGTLRITWSASGSGWLTSDTVRIEYATTGANWTVLSGASSLPATGSFNWLLPTPATAGATYALRVVCNQQPSVLAATAQPVSVIRVAASYYLNDASTAGDRYCTAPGASNHSGKSPSQPLPTLDALLSQTALGPGDTVYWDAGSYTQSVNTTLAATHQGAPGAPIRILGVPNATHLVRAGTTSDRQCLVIHADHVRIEGLTCRAATVGILVNASTARNVALVGNVCSDNTDFGIRVVPFVSGGTTVKGEYHILQNVVINDTSAGAGIYLESGYDYTPDEKTVFLVENNTVLTPRICLRMVNWGSASNRRTHYLKNNILVTTGGDENAICVVARPNTISYSDYNNLHASGGGWVGAWEGVNTYSNRFATLSQWQGASGHDKNSLSVPSRFVSPAGDNLRLQPDSPCVDAAVASFWMFNATDADAAPRLVGRSADMGAYELNLRAGVRLFLQGPFISGTDRMGAQLSQAGLLPLKAPYADDPRTVTAVPSNVTDWVLLQFRVSPDGPALLSRSVFLSRDGWLVDDAGSPQLAINLPPAGAYHLVVKHRNHLAAMSAQPLAFSNQTLTCDFTLSPGAYAGSTLACAPVTGSNAVTRWALRAGDLDGDGRVAAIDYDMWASPSAASGYRRGDTDLNGAVDAADAAHIQPGAGHASSVPRPETWLLPALRLTPSRLTVLSGESVTVADAAADAAPLSGVLQTGFVAQASAPLQWGFAWNGSGATLAAETDSQATYTAGALTGRTDTVQAWDADDALGRSVLNVIGAQSAAAAGQALILAGRTSTSDVLWPTTDYLADSAYTTLRYRGFSKENLHYLSPEPDQDVDGNGLLDDIDGAATFAAAANAFTNNVVGADRLFVYLVDHGGTSSGNGYFRLNATETLTATQLDTWLDALQDAHDTPVIVLLDFCYAGSFLPALTYTGTATRIVIAACADDQPTYFVAGGLVSFSGAFFSGVMLGRDVMDAFTMAQSAMSAYQSARLDDDKDGLYTDDDGTQATGTTIGPTYVAAGDAPQIGEVCGNQVLTEETAATLWIGSVSAVHPITRAWCLVIPPQHNPDPDNPVTDLPTLELAYDEETGRYSATYDGFTAAGTYNATFYVQDEEGNVSAPRQAYIAQIGFDDRVILVTGGDTNGAAWPAITSLAELTYDTLRLRLFTPDRIHILTPSGNHDFDGDGTNDVSGAATCANLQAAIGAWAVTNATDRLTLYLLGEGAANAFRINTAEAVTTNALSDWVYAFQATNPVPVTLILDFSGSGAFLPLLADRPDSPDVARIAIASAAAGREALFANSGTVSFTQYLLSRIIAGNTLGDAFTEARRAIRRISGGVRQRAQLDDTRNGIANEKNADGAVAAEAYLGSAFVTGADAPAIGSVLPPQILLTPGAAVTLWAGDVAGMYPLSNVWCAVTAPDADPAADLPTVALSWNAHSNRYETVTNLFTQAGAYVLTFYAQDTAGAVSAPRQSEILLEDAYEPDDEPGLASLYSGASQLHTFLSADDADWVRVYLVSNFVYEIETDLVSEALDTVIDFYRAGADDTLELIDHVDEEGYDFGEYTGIDFPESGWYWLRLSPYVEGTNSVGAYRFSIDIPAADGLCNLIVLGMDDVTAGALPTGSVAKVEGQADKPFNGATAVVFPALTNGAYLVRVPAPDDFMPREDPDLPGQVQSLTNAYYANPRTVAVSGTWMLTGFEFYSTLAVTSGVVRDAWTGAWVGGAQLQFTAASGNLAGSVATGSVMFTRYGTNWLSAAHGAAPSGIVLGACDWDLDVTCPGYEPYAAPGVVSNLATGARMDLGTLYLVPSDTNSNGVADDWEALHFPGGMDAEADEDADNIDNRSEYLCGTDPTDPASALRFFGLQMTGGGAQLAWSVTGGRSYQILSVTSLVGSASVATNGPWQAAYGQTTQTWHDVTSPPSASRFYRIRLNTP